MIAPNKLWLMTVFHLYVKCLQEYHKVLSLVINDIAKGVHSHIKFFADDCQIYRAIQTPSDQYVLQQDLNTLVK